MIYPVIPSRCSLLVIKRKKKRQTCVYFERNLDKIIREASSFKLYHDRKFSNFSPQVLKMSHKALDLNKFI